MQLTDEQRAAHFLEKLTKGSVKEKLAALTVLGLEVRTATLQMNAVLAGLIPHVEKQNKLVISLAERFLELARAFDGTGLNDASATVEALRQIHESALADAAELQKIFDLTEPPPERNPNAK